MAKIPEIRRYDPEESAVFRRNQDKWGWLSNFYPCQIAVNGLRAYHSEGLYQAARFPSRPDIQQKICIQRNPMVSKRTAHNHIGLTRRDWQSTTIRTMRWVLRVKLAQNWDEFGGMLRETGDLSIVEYSVRDGFWGADHGDDGQLVGVNALGRLLMELRAELVGPDGEQLRTVEAPTVPGLKMNGKKVGMLGDIHQELPDPEKGKVPTKVVNVTKTSKYDLYIGRPSKRYGPDAKYGNPFRVGKDGTRAQVIHLFENWLRDCIRMGHLYVADASQIGQAAERVGGARRGTLGEQRVLLYCAASSKTPLSLHLWLRTDTRARGPNLQVWSTKA